MGSFAVAVLIAGGLMVPSAAFAEVSIDGSELSQGENEVGGGTATLSESMLDMVNVVADTLYSDENLTVNFNGGNELDDVVAVGSATVELNFTGENEIEDVTAGGSANVTVNANGHNEFEDVNAYENANVTVNVTGENDFETIMGYDNANITVRGTSCQRRDIVNLKGDDDLAFLDTGSGDLTIDHVTVNLEAEGAVVGSDMGNVVIDTSKIGKGDGNT